MAVALVLWTGATVALAADLQVRRVVPPGAVTRAGRTMPQPGARTLTAGERDFIRLRSARQREFLPMQRLLMAPQLRVDRSQWAARREGWQLPGGVTRDDASPNGYSVSELVQPDTIRMAWLRVDFLHDRGGTKSTGDGRFDLTGPDTTVVPIDRPPHNRAFYQSHAEAMKRYYEVQSYGRVVFQIDVWPAEQDSSYHLGDMADLGPWAFGNSVYDAAVRMFRGMFFAADSQSAARGQRIPWQKYDRFMVVHAGGDLQSDVKQDSKEDIPSFTVFLGDTNVVVFPDSAQWNLERPIDRASFVPETINQDGYFGALNGVIAHENGHNNFGFLDVYDIESGYPICGYWSLMDSGNLVGSRVILKDGSEIFAVGMLPPSIDPFQRNFISNGMDVRVPAWGDTLALVGNERSNVFYKVPLSSDEYLLLENRYLSPADTLLQLDADSVTRVVLGPKQPDRFEYDALEPGGGILVWHVDDSVVPFERSLRINPDYGLNSNYARQGMQIIEADGLDDLGDPGSPFILGSPTDPYQLHINPSLSDSTLPNLLPNQLTHPHVRLDFLDDAADTMHFTANRTWTLASFPYTHASYPPGGPLPLAIDADGDRRLDICWAGGDTARVDTSRYDPTGLFAITPDGHGLGGGAFAFGHVDRRPRREMAATLTGDPALGVGPAVFAVTTYADSAADTLGGRVWLVGSNGLPQPGWPVRLPAHASTPPVIAGTWPIIAVIVGAEDGRVYALDRNGALLASSSFALPGGVTGTLAVWLGGGALPTAAARVRTGAAVVPTALTLIAAGGAGGKLEVLSFAGTGAGGLALVDDAVAGGPGWPRQVGPAGFAPDFLWLDFGGTGANADANCGAYPTLVAHHADRLWAYCATGQPLAGGWGHSFGDTIVAGLGAGDPDGDGFPEVLVQTIRSEVAFVNRDGYPSPGWPRRSTTESLRTESPALALDVDGDGRSEVVVLNGSGVIAPLRADGRVPAGWPLATGAGAAGALVAADLNRTGTLDLVGPDRDSLLYAYSIPVRASSEVATSWTMLGGDPGRTCALPATRTPLALAPAAGPLERGSFKAFPNPARRQPVSFAYSLSENARVQFRILDASGHEVATFERTGQRAENRELWDPGALPAGLYMASVRFVGAHGTQVAVIPVGLLR